MGTIFSTAYKGVGTTLSSSFYMRNFYTSNRDARTASKRSGMSNIDLALADGLALRRAVKQLGSSDFDSSQDDSIRSSALAFIDTYNNALSSTSGSADYAMTRNTKQLKAISKEYTSQLDKIGITVNDNGSLTSRTSLFSSADISKFKAIFSSESDYMQRTAACAKRIEQRSAALDLTAKTQALSKQGAGKTDNSTPGTATTAAALESSTTPAAHIVSESMDLDALLNTGIGKNINLIL